MPNLTTENAHKALLIADNWATANGSREVDSEHLLVGLLFEGEGLASVALRLVGIEPNSFLGGPAGQADDLDRPGHLSLSSDALDVFRSTVRRSQEFGVQPIGTAHFLLGLLDIPEANGVKLLKKLGADLELLRNETIKLTSSPGVLAREPLQAEDSESIGRVYSVSSEIHPLEE
ncbi:MAG: Clp protease N-terminal domain-containing protein [Actinomycetota bacterium]